MESEVLFVDKYAKKNIYEHDLVGTDGDRCPTCHIMIKTEDGKVTFVGRGRLWCWVQETGQVIKKCSCKAWLKLPYSIEKIK